MRDLMDNSDLYRMVDEVLHYLWDPIGVSGVLHARDEYYGYVPTVYCLLRDGADERMLADHLGKVATESMGLLPNPDRDHGVASVLLDWKEIVRSSPSTLRLSLPPMPAYKD